MAWSELIILAWWIQHAPLIKLGALLPASEKKAASSVPEQCARGGRGPSLIYVKPYAGRALKVSLLNRSLWLSAKMTRLVRCRYRRPAYRAVRREAHMDSSSSPSGSSAYLESLMRAGQQSMKQFDDALVSAMGVEGKPATGDAYRRLPSRQTCNGNFGLRLWSSGKAPSATHLQRVPGGRAGKGASRTRPGSTRLTTNSSRSPT